jgi:hypothetical protein
MRRRLAAALVPSAAVAALAGAVAHATAPPVRPPLSAELDSCTTGPTAPDRTAVFKGSMPSMSGAWQMSMRFDLLERRRRSRGFRRVAVPKMGVWERSRRDPLLPGLIITKRVDGLGAPGAYRAVVRFRWYDAEGRIVRRARRVTGVCIQRDPRPDLTISGLAVIPGPDREHARYVVEVLNRGRGDAAVPFDIVLTINGVAQRAQTLATLGARGRGRVSFVAPRCTSGSAVRAAVDPADSIDEVSEANNTVARPCPSAAPARA